MVVSVNGQNGPNVQRRAIRVFTNEHEIAIPHHQRMGVTGVRARITTLNVAKSRIVQVTIVHYASGGKHCASCGEKC